MDLTEVTPGVTAPSREDRDLLRGVLRVLGLRRVVTGLEEHCTAPGDRAVLRFVEARPPVVILDIQQPPGPSGRWKWVHAARPEAWILAISPVNDPVLIGGEP